MVNGTLISFEGPEGAGKSSVLEAVLPLLEEKGIPFITTREPGGVDIAEKIRQVILDPDHTRMDAKTELLLYIASRRQHLVERVLPALAAGKIVLMDRFIDSSVAYQGWKISSGSINSRQMVLNQISPFTLIWMLKKGSPELPKTKSGKSIVWIWKVWSFTKKSDKVIWPCTKRNQSAL